jgi:prolyl-tRNA editing enzyme YbaK/EbsC (Cys-tRNA(Pro) deacylase)
MDEQKQLKESSQRFQKTLDGLHLAAEVREMPDSTHTAAEAASAIGCTLAQIVKSLIFRGCTSGKPVLVLASGPNRVNEKALATLAGEKIERATPEFVRESTGYVIGGVPPLGHAVTPQVWMDEDLLGFANVWAAAGTPRSVFEVDPRELQRLSHATVISLR